MPDEKKPNESREREPVGFTPRSGGLASEYAREQGWELNEAERTKTSTEKQAYDGGLDYEYGAQDFGDTAVDTSSAKTPEESALEENKPADSKPGTGSALPRSQDL